MLLSPHRASTFCDLLRLVAVWMAAALLLQGFAAVHARAAGPAHEHRSQRASGLFAHRHHHDETARHHHAASDPTVMAASAATAAEEGLDAAAAALVAAFALLAIARAPRPAAIGGHVWCARRVRTHRSTCVEPLLKPPRTA